MKGTEFKKISAILLTLSIVIMLIPIMAMPASAATEVTNEAELKNALDSGETDIIISSTVTISSNSLTINSGVTVSIPNYNNKLTINSGVTLTVKGTIDGYLTNRGTIDNRGTMNGGFANYGTIDNNKGGVINGQFHNYYGGTINNKGTISGGFNNEGTIDNAGIIDNSRVTAQGYSQTIENWYTIINSGTIDNSGGKIENIYGGGSIKGTITNSGTIKNTDGGSIKNENPCTITNNKGTIDNNGGKIWNGGTIKNTNGGKITNLDKGVFDNVNTYNDNNGKGDSSTPSPSTKSTSPSDSNPNNNPTAPSGSNPSNGDDQSGGFDRVLLIVAVGVILAIVGGCVLLLLRKRK